MIRWQFGERLHLVAWQTLLRAATNAQFPPIDIIECFLHRAFVIEGAASKTFGNQPRPERKDNSSAGGFKSLSSGMS